MTATQFREEPRIVDFDRELHTIANGFVAQNHDAEKLARGSSKMAVNHADGTMFVSVPMYPIIASYAAFVSDARWLTPVFLVTGLAFGLCIVTASRFMLYRGMNRFFDSQMMRNENGWPALIAGPPLLLAFIAFPYATTGFGFFVTYACSVWIANALST